MSSALTIAMSLHATNANAKSMMNLKNPSTSSAFSADIVTTEGVHRAGTIVRKIPVRGIDHNAQLAWERKRHQDFERMRELARRDEFSDSESDGVESDGVESEIDSEPELDDLDQDEIDNDTILVPSEQKEAPATDDWMLVDKSPTFMSVVKGTNDLGESWFIHTTPSSQPTYFNHPKQNAP